MVMVMMMMMMMVMTMMLMMMMMTLTVSHADLIYWHSQYFASFSSDVSLTETEHRLLLVMDDEVTRKWKEEREGLAPTILTFT